MSLFNMSVAQNISSCWPSLFLVKSLEKLVPSCMLLYHMLVWFPVKVKKSKAVPVTGLGGL
jgi:hypothetical protein